MAPAAAELIVIALTVSKSRFVYDVPILVRAKISVMAAPLQSVPVRVTVLALSFAAVVNKTLRGVSNVATPAVTKVPFSVKDVAGVCVVQMLLALAVARGPTVTVTGRMLGPFQKIFKQD
jgi:hypothetical protein